MTIRLTTITSDTPIGFVGTGVMGGPMAAHLARAGRPLHVHNRTRSKADALVEAGAIWHDSPRGVAEACEVVITMLGFPEDVESTYLDPARGVLPAMDGGLVIDMTTSRPDLAVKLAEAAAERGVASLDAPVSGGDVGAKKAALSIMVGGDEQAVAAAMPMFEQMGKTIVHQGPPGSGQHCKMCNQIAVAAGMLGASEAMAYARSAGLDPHVVLQSITGGAAGSWALSNLAGRMVDGDFAAGFYVKHFVKDLSIALDGAERLGVDVPGVRLARTLYERLLNEGGGDDGTQALYRLYGQQQEGKPS